MSLEDAVNMGCLFFSRNWRLDSDSVNSSCLLLLRDKLARDSCSLSPAYGYSIKTL